MRGHVGQLLTQNTRPETCSESRVWRKTSEFSKQQLIFWTSVTVFVSRLVPSSTHTYTHWFLDIEEWKQNKKDKKLNSTVRRITSENICGACVGWSSFNALFITISRFWPNCYTQKVSNFQSWLDAGTRETPGWSLGQTTPTGSLDREAGERGLIADQRMTGAWAVKSDVCIYWQHAHACEGESRTWIVESGWNLLRPHKPHSQVSDSWTSRMKKPTDQS